MRTWNREIHRYTYDHVWEIYALVDPRTKKPKYVGRTMRGPARLTSHLCDAEANGANGRHYNNRLREWLMLLRSLDLSPKFRVLTRRKTYQGALRAERKWIRTFGELNIMGKKQGDRTRYHTKQWRKSLELVKQYFELNQ